MLRLPRAHVSELAAPPENGACCLSSRKDVVETYIEGFRRSDHELILSCLTDDVVWELPGYATVIGKDAFDKEIENEATVGSPKLTVDRLIEEGDSVVAVGRGEVARRNDPLLTFVFSDVFTFTGDKISRVESYLVTLS